MISRLGTNSRVNIIIGTSFINRSEKNVKVYVYSDNSLQEPPTFSDSDTYSFMDVKDLDMDGELEFLRLARASNGVPALAEAYKLDESGTYHRMALELGELEAQDIDNETDWLLAEMKYRTIDSLGKCGIGIACSGRDGTVSEVNRKS